MFFASRRGSWRIWLVMGLGLCLYGYYDWSMLNVPSEADLALAIDVQYRAEVARMQALAGEAPVELTPEWQDKFKSAIRKEQMAPIEKTKRRIQSTVGFGLIVIVLAGGMLISARLSEKQKH